MAVQFVIGRAGSGKTRRCLEAILTALRADPLGPPIYWILPRQATFQAERALTCAAGAFCRARVVSFERLGREIFACAGGNVIPEVTPLGRQMVIGHLLRQLKPRLRFFASSARQPGLAVELDAAFAEFERSGRTPAGLGVIVDDLELARPTDVDGASLLAKLRDLRLVYDAYRKYLGQERLDPHQRLQQVLGCLDVCTPLEGATVYVDAFTEFSDFERRLLAGLSKVAARLEVTLPLDPDSPVVRDAHKLPEEMSLFHQTEQTYRRLWFAFAEAGAMVENPVRLSEVCRFRSPILGQIERELFAEGVRQIGAPKPFNPPPRADERVGEDGTLPPSAPPPHVIQSGASAPQRRVAQTPSSGEERLRSFAPLRMTRARQDGSSGAGSIDPSAQPPARDARGASGAGSTDPSAHPSARGAAGAGSIDPSAHPPARGAGGAESIDPSAGRLTHESATTLPPPVGLLVAPNRAAEVDAAARGIRALWREGYRLRDIAVLVREVELYHALIDASFGEHGIAYFVDRRRSAVHHPLLQFVRSVFQIIRFEWPNEAVLSLMKSGLAGLTPGEADEVENYIALHRIRGLAWESPEPWAYRRLITRGEDDDSAPERPETVDDFRRRVVDKLRPSASLLRLHEWLPVRDIAAELFTVLDRFGVRETLAAWADAAAPGDPEQAAEHEQVWAEFVDLFDQMVDLLGGERVTLVDFIDVLESGLERFDLALTPPTVDQVLVGQVDRTRTPDLKAVFLLGMNEGEFPRVSREPSVLTEPERKELRRRHVELDADRRRQLHDEDLLGYLAFTRASERLIVSRPRADDNGRPVDPSRFWQRLRELVPDAPLVEIPQDARDDVRLMETPRQVVVALMRWVREGRSSQIVAGSDAEIRNPKSEIQNQKAVSPTLSPECWGEGDCIWPALYQWLATYPCRDDAIDRTRHLAWRAVGYANNAALSPDIASQLFRTPLEASTRQIETFAACPFKHYVRYGLGLTDRESPGVTGLDLSQVYHQVLDIVVREVLERNADWQQLARVVTPEMIRTHAQAIGQALRGELMLSTARNKYLLGRVERTLNEFVASQAEMMRRGQFRPSFTGVGFGEKGPLPALRVTTPAGRTAVLSGRIDRVDVLPAGEHVAVFDYKLAAGPQSMQDVYYGLSLQLLTYLLVLQANGGELAGRKLSPVAAFYLPLIRKVRDVKHPDEALDPATPRFHLRAKPRGVFDATYLDAFDAELEAGRSDVVAAYRNKAGGLGHRDTSDIADPAEFAALLGHVRRRLGELADQIVAGRVDVAPYWINRRTPCGQCDYRSVCRFETSVNRYTQLQPMGRQDVFRRITEGVDNGA